MQIPLEEQVGGALSIDAMRGLPATAAPQASNTWRWALTAGAHPPPPRGAAPGEVLVTGHDDGSASFWDLGAAAP